MKKSLATILVAIMLPLSALAEGISSSPVATPPLGIQPVSDSAEFVKPSPSISQPGAVMIPAIGKPKMKPGNPVSKKAHAPVTFDNTVRPQKATVVDLGILNGRSPWYGSLTKDGKVAGNIQGVGKTYPFIWERGVTKKLEVEGPLFGMNEKGQMLVPVFTNSGGSSGLFENGKLRKIRTISGGNTSSPKDINDSGQVVGVSELPPVSTSDDSGSEHAFLWSSNVTQDLGTLGGDFSEASAINNKGQIVGISSTDSKNAGPFLWENGNMANLGSFGGHYGKALDINDKGQVVGESAYADGGTHAFVWRDGVMKNLEVPKFDGSAALKINNAGEIVGFVVSPIPDDEYSQISSEKQWKEIEEHRAILWKNGVMVDLNKLFPPDVGVRLFEAVDINDAGQIIARGITDAQDDYHVFLISLPQNIPPQMTFTAPLESAFIPEASVMELNPESYHDFTGKISISWQDSDPDNNAAIAIYFYRIDRDHPLDISQQGTRIFSTSENKEGRGDRFTWDISAFPSGTYTWYAMVDDGVNEPVKVYSPGLKRELDIMEFAKQQ